MLSLSGVSSPHSKNLPSPEFSSHKRLLSLVPVVEKYGFCVIPLNGKRPAIKDWPSKASSDPDVLHHWAKLYKSANWGFATGKKSGITALDIDGKWALNTLQELEQQHGILPGPRVKTGGGGIHLYFQYSPDLQNGLRVTKPGEKGEILICGDGRQLVAPGSVHPDTGNVYVWMERCSPSECPIKPVPAWLQDWVLSNAGVKRQSAQSKDTSRATKAAQTEHNATAVAVEEGSRNHELHAWVCEQVFRVLNSGQQLDYAQISAEAEEVNQTHFRPPYSQDELSDRVRRSINRAVEDWQKSKKGMPRGLRKIKPQLVKEAEPIIWQPSITFDVFSGPSFPVTSLARSKWLESFVASVAMAFQVPVEMPAMLSLAMIAGALQRVVTISPRPGWEEPLPLFLCIASEPGSNKSQVHSLLVSPLLDWEQRINDESAFQRREWAAERRVLTNRMEKMEKRAAGIEDAGERRSLIGQIAELREQLDGIPSGAPLQWVYDDATSEILEKGMAENREVAILTSAEGRVFDQLVGATSDGRVNLNVFLKGHSGDELRVNRVTRDPVHLKKPLLTLAVMTQPDVVAGLAAKRELAGRGLLARFAFVIPKSNVGHRKIDVPHVDDTACQVYASILQRLLTVGLEQNNIIVRFSSEAASLFSEFRMEIEARLDPAAHDLHGLSSWASKLPGLTARLAGVLHVAQQVDAWSSTEIQAATLSDAIDISRYLIEHSRVAFGLMRADPLQTDAQYLLNVMIKAARNNTVSKLKRHEVWQLTKRHFRSAETLNRALDVLESRNMIAVRQEPGAGVKPVEFYLVNPDLLKDDLVKEESARQGALFKSISNQLPLPEVTQKEGRDQ